MKTVSIVKLMCLAMLLTLASLAFARGTYQEPADFISEVFTGKPPQAKALWLTADMELEAGKILGHPFVQRRVRYWQVGERSAWVLDEIGKEEPITTGIVINAGKIEQVRVLVYRESRGAEVRYPRFTGQFTGARLKNQQELDRDIDVISGATLSVNALTRLARLALYLAGQVQAGK